MTTRAKQPGGARKRSIGRHVAIGFGLVSAIAITMCGVLLAVITQVSGLVTAMRADEVATRESLDLATGVREQYMHIAHALIERDRSHDAHYERWLRRIAEDLKGLRDRTPDEEVWRLDEIRGDSARMDELFRGVLLPAAERGDLEQVRAEHREVEKMSQRAAQNADFLARSVDARMAFMHEEATSAVRLGLLGGGLCVLLVLVVSVAYTLRLRAALLRPLSTLTEAAKRFGSGDFKFRVGSVGEGELRAVSEAFDRMAEELAVREQRLLQNERMAAIGQLAAGVAHEMNNPIGIIRGYLKTMRPDGDKQALAEELLILDEEAAACQRIADDLLTFARIPQLQQCRLNMEHLLEETMRRFRAAPETRDHALVLRAGPGHVHADPDRLRQVLVNLVRNAVQMSQTEAAVEIEGVRLEDGSYQIDVSDRGPGIDLIDQDRIFEPFYTKRRGGSGLGLAVCQGVVRAHSGSIHFLEREGGGTTFRVVLPPVPREGANVQQSEQVT